MDAKKVEILLEAVESGSMMGIAGQNGYTPSGLSHLLRRLEAELGVQLVERTNRGIALSENGKRLLPYLRGYVESFETLEREAALLRNETETTLRLGAYASIAKNWMPSLLRAFGKAYPQIRVELEVLSRQELYRAMKEDRLHLIFACEDQTQPYHFLQTIVVAGGAVLSAYKRRERRVIGLFDCALISATFSAETRVSTIKSTGFPGIACMIAKTSTLTNRTTNTPIHKRFATNLIISFISSYLYVAFIH